MNRAMEKLESFLEIGGIEKLVHLTPQTARVLREGSEEIIPAEQVQVGDRIRVLPGEGVPVDGVNDAPALKKADVGIAITPAITGTLSPVVGALVHNAGSVLVITNSALLLNWRKKS